MNIKIQESMFSTNFYKFKFYYKHRNELIKNIIKRYDSEPILKPISWNENVHTSFYYDHNSDNFLFSKAGIPVGLVEEISNVTIAMLDQEDVKSIGNFYISEIWYNAYKNHQYQNPHKHNNLNRKNTIFSGIWYLKYNPSIHSSTRFFNPNFDLDKNLIQNNKHLCFSPEVEENDIIIFPSNVEHDVPKQSCDDLRITVAFNIDCELVES